MASHTSATLQDKEPDELISAELASFYKHRAQLRNTPSIIHGKKVRRSEPVEVLLEGRINNDFIKQ